MFIQILESRVKCKKNTVPLCFGCCLINKRERIQLIFAERNFSYFVAPVRISKLLDCARERERENIYALDVSLPRIAVKYHTPLKRSDENFQNDRRELRFVRVVLQSRTL